MREAFAELGHVLLHDALAAGVAALADFLEQVAGNGAALCSPLVQVRLVGVEDARAVGPPADQELVRVRGACEAADRVAGQPEPAGNRTQSDALVEGSMDGRVLFTDAVGKPAGCPRPGGRGWFEVAILRGYQPRGLAWLDRLTRLGLGACLADDTGLGKTITAIALHLRRQEDPRTACGPTLVVCPAALLGNWGREIDRFAPGTPWRRHHGPARDLGDLRPGEIVLTTYGTLRRDLSDLCMARERLLTRPLPGLSGSPLLRRTGGRHRPARTAIRRPDPPVGAVRASG
jgi:hypothetical protein